MLMDVGKRHGSREFHICSIQARGWSGKGRIKTVPPAPDRCYRRLATETEVTMRYRLSWLALMALSTSPAVAQAPALGQISAVDRAAAFRAAGFKRVAGTWQACGDPGTASYTPGQIETLRDINGDGLPDAVITEGSAFCFGMTGQSYAVVSKRPGGSWRLIDSGVGMVTFLPRRTATGWPDIEIGGPGFCFPVERWNGRAYVLHRHQYEGKPCRPGR